MAAVFLAATAALSGGSAGAQRADDEPPVSLTRGVDSLVRATDTYIAQSFCLPDLRVASLDTMFDTEPGGIIGADYPRTLALSDGRVLWTFQDARIRTPTGSRYVHSIGMLQTGLCFDVLVGGSSSSPESWLFPNDTAPEYRWFWPLDAEIGADGQVYVFAVEMRELGVHYLDRAVPQGVYVARVDPSTANIEWYGRPADQSTALYGWSIESDDHWTYLFAHCNRQFGFDDFFGGAVHDRTCARRVTLARVPLGRMFDAPSYWTGSGWSADPARATSVLPSRGSFTNPAQFVRSNGRWLAVTKLDDWFGTDIVIDSAVHPGGPYTEVERRRATPKCPTTECNTYFASWIEGQNLGGPGDPLITSLSHNRWDGEATSVYRPTFSVVTPPPAGPTSAMRCRLGHCA